MSSTEYDGAALRTNFTGPYHATYLVMNNVGRAGSLVLVIFILFILTAQWAWLFKPPW